MVKAALRHQPVRPRPWVRDPQLLDVLCGLAHLRVGEHAIDGGREGGHDPRRHETAGEQGILGGVAAERARPGRQHQRLVAALRTLLIRRAPVRKARADALAEEVAVELAVLNVVADRAQHAAHPVVEALARRGDHRQHRRRVDLHHRAFEGQPRARAASHRNVPPAAHRAQLQIFR
eukprot:3935144-Rhodomonas_salina.3